MESQLKQQGAGDRLKEVLAEVPAVRKDAGYPPLVTPSSQIVGTQAVFNVLMGRYKVLTGEFADLMLGYYGSTLGREESRGREAAVKHAKKADHRPARRPAQAGVGGAARRRPWRIEGCNGYRRGRPDLRHVSAGGAEVLQDAPEGPKNLGKEPRPSRPSRRHASRQPVDGRDPRLPHPIPM